MSNDKLFPTYKEREQQLLDRTIRLIDLGFDPVMQYYHCGVVGMYRGVWIDDRHEISKQDIVSEYAYRNSAEIRREALRASLGSVDRAWSDFENKINKRFMEVF